MNPTNNTPTTSASDTHKNRGRSPQANGKMHGNNVDRRRASAKRYRDVVAGICKELGRDFATLPVTVQTLVHMLAGLIVQAEQQAADMAAGKPVDSNEQVRVSGALSRLLDDLGLSPQAPSERTRGHRYASSTLDRRLQRGVRLVLRDADDQAREGTTLEADGNLILFISPDEVGMIAEPKPVTVDVEPTNGAQQRKVPAAR